MFLTCQVMNGGMTGKQLLLHRAIFAAASARSFKLAGNRIQSCALGAALRLPSHTTQPLTQSASHTRM